MLAPLAEGVFEGCAHLRRGRLGNAALGLLGEQDAIDDFVLGLGAEFPVALAAGNFAKQFRLRLQAGEGIIHEGRIDGLAIHPEHVSACR